jgi:hypothetical protein
LVLLSFKKFHLHENWIGLIKKVIFQVRRKYWSRLSLWETMQCELWMCGKYVHG